MSLALIMTAAVSLAATPSADELLKGAEARIQRHRTREAVLRLLPPEGQELPAGAMVSIEQTRHQFLFGCNIFVLNRLDTPEHNEAYARRFRELLNYATLPFYWATYEPKQGQENDARTRELLDFCEQHRIRVKGHPMAWNWEDPPWLPDDPKEVLRLQMERIGRLARRFDGRIEIWDVVNEATHHDRPDFRQRCPKLTAAIDHAGVPNFVQTAFRTAREANPDATLVINDYRHDAAFAEKVIEKLVDPQGKPLYDVIGIQSHQHGGAMPLPEVWEVCERFAKFGKPLHFTENTFLSGELGWDLKLARKGFKWESTPEGEARQARDVVNFYTLLFSHPAVEAITWWDFTDKKSWQGAPAGLLRADLTPKPAYDELHKLIKGRWWTKTQTQLSAGGQAGFRGFLGDYRVVVTTPQGRWQGEFTLEKGDGGAIEVQLK